MPWHILMPDRPFSEQAIPPARLRLEQASIRAERLADGCRVNLKRVLQDDRTWPDAAHQFVFGDKLACLLGQDFDDLEGSATDWHSRPEDP
jgi:hypothetical protein